MQYRLAAILLAGSAVPASAEVARRGPEGFTSVHRVRVAAAPDQLWAVLIAPQRWWSSDHTYSGDADRLSLNPVPGGCWCETLATGGGVEHMRVVYADPGKILRLAGALGPLQSGAINGTLSFTLEPITGGTEMVVSYIVAGSHPAGIETLATPVDGVLAAQLPRLKAAAEAVSK